ncbi:MAG: metallophosphoesterase [Clostridia bacterium]|nr:metallophosphoesterase [Clostridia bacterium]
MAKAVFYLKQAIRTVSRPLFAHRHPLPPQVEEIPVEITGLSAAFEGYTIAVVSDLHLPDNLCSPDDIIHTLTAIQPNSILLPGDMANRYAAFDEQGLRHFFTELIKIAPCYAITGNHEQKSPDLAAYRQLLEAVGVNLLYDRWDTLIKSGDTLPIYGACTEKLPEKAEHTPSLLLVHNPVKAVKLQNSGFSLAVCGHAHGGQLRFGRQGLYAPGQGFFPKYTSGLYSFPFMQMVVSRGLGDSSITLRLNNPPHLPILKLKAKA